MKKLVAISLTILSLTASLPAKAGGVPVIDAAGIAKAVATLQQLQKTYRIESKQWKTAVKQLDEAAKAAKRLETQVKQLDRQFEALTGTRDMGALLNGSAIKDARRIASKIGDIHATLQGEEGALPPDHPLAGRLNQRMILPLRQQPLRLFSQEIASVGPTPRLLVWNHYLVRSIPQRRI